MKFKDYAQILRARGFKARELSKYQGQNIYEKEHKYNKVVCTVIKDTHGKAQEMTFNIYPTLENPVFNMEQFKEAEFDRGFLLKEINIIHAAFEKLKAMKRPMKYIYCF